MRPPYPYLKIAAERVEKDNRDRWMAVRALGMIGDTTVAPELIHLTYHPNQNTRFWAQISLVRLTGMNFATDWQAWGDWWDKQGRQPAFSPAPAQWTANPEYADPQKMKQSDEAFIQKLKGTQIPAAAPPRIVETVPAAGAKEVDPALQSITVTFDRDMGEGCSWTGGGEYYPKTTGRPLWRDARTCVLPVALEPGRFYRVGINSTSYTNFRGKEGVPAPASAICFTTAGAPENLVAALQPPRVVSLTPPNGATDVSPALTELRATFDQEMGGGCSWVRLGLDGQFPETAGKPSWAPDRRTCVLPVSLKPNTSYRLGLNSEGIVNFSSAFGAPLEPVVYSFQTGAQ